jgi:hypothetical protein
MDNITVYLQDWFERLLKHKDIMQRSIKEIKRIGNRLEVEYKAGHKTCYIITHLKDLDLSEIKDIENPMIVMLNSEENFAEFVKIWPKLISHTKLCVYSVNPFSEPDSKWVLFPYTHHQISDADSLETGLRTIFESVESITPEEFSQKI